MSLEPPQSSRGWALWPVHWQAGFRIPTSCEDEQFQKFWGELMAGWICSKKRRSISKKPRTSTKKNVNMIQKSIGDMYIVYQYEYCYPYLYCVSYLCVCLYLCSFTHYIHVQYTYTYTSSIHVFRAFFAVNIGECLGIPKDYQLPLRHPKMLGMCFRRFEKICNIFMLYPYYIYIDIVGRYIIHIYISLIICTHFLGPWVLFLGLRFPSSSNHSLGFPMADPLGSISGIPRDPATHAISPGPVMNHLGAPVFRHQPKWKPIEIGFLKKKKNMVVKHEKMHVLPMFWCWTPGFHR